MMPGTMVPFMPVSLSDLGYSAQQLPGSLKISPEFALNADVGAKRRLEEMKSKLWEVLYTSPEVKKAVKLFSILGFQAQCSPSMWPPSVGPPTRCVGLEDCAVLP